MLAVTGIGIVCSLGSSPKEVFNSILSFNSSKNSALKLPNNISKEFKEIGAPLVAEVPLSNTELFSMLNKKGICLERIPRATLLALNAVNQAIIDANLNEQNVSPHRIGIFGATTLAGTDRLEVAVREYHLKGRLTKPKLLVNTNYSAFVNTIGEIFGWGGHRVMVSTACSSSTVVMKFAYDSILNGNLDVAIVLGADPITEISLAGFSVLGPLTDGVSTPFSHEKHGITLGEGAGAFVLQAKPSNTQKVYAWLGGVGIASDCYHLTAPDPYGRGALAAMKESIARSGRQEHEIQAIIAHGTGTELNDISESKAIMNLGARKPFVISTKGATGHTLGAAGVINAVVACMCLENNSFPASPKFTSPRKGIDVNISKENEHSANLNGILTNSFGFGGSVASAVFYKEPCQHKDNYANKSKNGKDRVYITGSGVVTPLGCSNETLAKAILEGTRYFKTHNDIQSFTGRRSTNLSGKVEIENDSTIKSILRKCRHYRKMDRTSVLSYSATSLALTHAKFTIKSKNQNEIGLLLGSDTGPIEVLHQFYNSIIAHGRNSANPSLFPNTVLNACLGYITMDFLIRGPSVLFSQGLVASSVAMAHAKDLLADQNEKYSSMLCGGVDELSEYLIKGYLDILQIPNKAKGDFTTEPLSEESQGFILGESSILFLLEKERCALERNACIEAEFAGSVSLGSEKHFINMESSSELVSSVLNKTVNIYGLPDLIVVNATGLPIHDKIIIKGINKSTAKNVSLYAPLRIFGNCRGTSGALGVFTALTALKHQKLPNFDRTALSISGDVNTIFVLTLDEGRYTVVNVIRKPV